MALQHHAIPYVLQPAVNARQASAAHDMCNASSHQMHTRAAALSSYVPGAAVVAVM
jgi:hypothetical protein